MKKMCKPLALIAVCLLVFVSWVIWGNVTVGLNQVTIVQSNLPDGFDGYRIAHVSDLHNSVLWEKALAKLKLAAPDIICITGDLVDSNRTDVDVALAFAAEAVKIAPCYYVPGNHEGRLQAAVYTQLLDGLNVLGVTVLEDEEVFLTRSDDTISLVGRAWCQPNRVGGLSDFGGYCLLLSHHPEYFVDYVAAGYDLVLAGHIHGGQFRIPFLGGLYAPNQGLFPEYDGGLYASGDTTMYISRGIGNSVFPVRLNNRPEVVLITLVSASLKA